MSDRFPWYDSNWLGAYVDAKRYIAHRHPGHLESFVATFDKLRTRPDFEVKRIGKVFDEATMAKIKETIASLEFNRFETHESPYMGRIIVHNHAYFAELQKEILPLVSELAGEPLDPLYNFLSLYTTLGRCPVHMDSPEAKWTLDLCIDQSEPWPIQFSKIVPWPEDLDTGGLRFEDWKPDVAPLRSLRFEPYTLQPGEALIFSGSSQWHFRDPIPNAGGKSFCNLLFFHFVPKGMEPIVRPSNWSRVFGIPELDAVVGDVYSAKRA